MIVDYLVDYAYLANRLKEDDTESFIGYVRELCNLVDFDNARLLVDVNLKCLDPLRHLGEQLTQASEFIGKQKSSVVNWFLTPQQTTHKFRKIPIDAGKELIDYLINHDIVRPPKYIISDDKRWRMNRSCSTLEEYFMSKEKEKYRLRRSNRRTYGVGDDFKDLKDDMEMFSCSDTDFFIIDRYLLKDDKKVQQNCETLVRWIGLLSNRANRKCKFKVLTCCDAEQKNVVCHLKSVKTKIFPKGNEQRIEIQVIQYTQTRDQYFHDRFICTPTRVIAIGKGLDVFVGNEKTQCFNIYYCGPREGDFVVQQNEKRKCNEVWTITI